MALELAWNFDGTGVAVDHSGHGRDLTIGAGNGNSARTAAGGGYTYGGTVPGRMGLHQTVNDIMTGPAMTGLNTASRTIEFWCKTQTNDPSWMMEFHNTANDTGAWGLLLLGGALSFRAKNAANQSFPVSLTQDSANFHHIAATHDGTNLKVYRDGVQVGSNVALSGAILTGDVFYPFDQSGSSGILSDVRIYSHVLTQSQIASDMNTPVTAATPGFIGWGVPL